MLSRYAQARLTGQLDREGWPREHHATIRDNRGRTQSRASVDGEELTRIGRLRLSLHHPHRSLLVARKAH